jgi:hypothetical protein
VEEVASEVAIHEILIREERIWTIGSWGNQDRRSGIVVIPSSHFRRRGEHYFTSS